MKRYDHSFVEFLDFFTYSRKNVFWGGGFLKINIDQLNTILHSIYTLFVLMKLNQHIWPYLVRWSKKHFSYCIGYNKKLRIRIQKMTKLLTAVFDVALGIKLVKEEWNAEMRAGKEAQAKVKNSFRKMWIFSHYFAFFILVEFSLSCSFC